MENKKVTIKEMTAEEMQAWFIGRCNDLMSCENMARVEQLLDSGYLPASPESFAHEPLCVEGVHMQKLQSMCEKFKVPDWNGQVSYIMCPINSSTGVVYRISSCNNLHLFVKVEDTWRYSKFTCRQDEWATWRQEEIEYRVGWVRKQVFSEINSA